MTPDDAPIPENDAIARAARHALGALAGPAAAGDLAWESVQSGARRVRTRRVAVVGAAFAIVLAGAGASATLTGNGGGGAVHVSHAGESTTTSEVSTSTTSSTTTTVPGLTVVTTPGVVVPPPTTTTVPPAPVAQPDDLAGTISLPSTTLVALQISKVTLTVRNVADHPVSLPVGLTKLGLYVDVTNCLIVDYTDDPAQNTLSPGEARTFTSDFVPGPDVIGDTQISAAFLAGLARDIYGYPVPILAGIPPVDITIVPPGRTAGEPLDPAQGRWRVDMSSDATTVTAGNSVIVRANVTNVGDQPQQTAAYGVLAAACVDTPTLKSSQSAHFLGAATLAPGAGQVFSFAYPVGSADVGTIYCSVGVAFPTPTGEFTEPHDGLASDTVAITVLPAGSTTTTSAPSPSP